MVPLGIVSLFSRACRRDSGKTTGPWDEKMYRNSMICADTRVDENHGIKMWSLQSKTGVLQFNIMYYHVIIDDPFSKT